MSKNYLSVQYDMKDEAKKYGSYYDGINKLWYIPKSINDENKKILEKKFNKALDSIIYLNVKYEDKKNVKKYGCKWDSILKKWYIPRNIPHENLKYLSIYNRA